MQGNDMSYKLGKSRSKLNIADLENQKFSFWVTIFYSSMLIPHKIDLFFQENLFEIVLEYL